VPGIKNPARSTPGAIPEFVLSELSASRSFVKREVFAPVNFLSQVAALPAPTEVDY
jgi:hypothetical protein